MSTASDAVAVAAQALTEALRASCADPADAVRLLIALINTPAVIDSPDPATRAAQVATAAMLRRCAYASLGQAVASYRPSSSTEALALASQIGALYDAEILVTADGGERDVYTALRALRSAALAALAAQAASLPTIVTVRTAQPEPSLVLAYRLYGDTYREPGLVARADVVNPLFMPPSFEALSS